MIYIKDIYTIGYSCFKINAFINILKQYKINALIDVRSNPNSEFYQEYNKTQLSNTLLNNKIRYKNYSYEFGAQQKDSKFYNNGYLDFNEFAKSEIFLKGVKKIDDCKDLDFSFVFMCAEKDPSTCHRSILVAREFKKIGYNIKNILFDGTYETQEDLEKRLVSKYFPYRDQLTLFDENLSWSSMVEKSYTYRNSEIGYKLINQERLLYANG